MSREFTNTMTTPEPAIDHDRLETASSRVRAALRDQLVRDGHWEGHLAESALSTAVAAFALHCYDPKANAGQITAAWRWLAKTQNDDGGWGDTADSPANMSTTLLALSALSPAPDEFQPPRRNAENWLERKLGSREPQVLRKAVLNFYGGDRTFSAPILALCTAAGLFGKPDHTAWQEVPQLPFELALAPHQLWPHLRLAVVSYAIPALITIGLVRHQHGGTRWCPIYRMRQLAIPRALKILRQKQPESGGYLEAAPLTGFVTMSLAVAGRADHPVAQEGARFLRENQREDGSWPIDTNLATWVSTLSVKALDPGDLPEPTARPLLKWLLDQQHTSEHPFTHTPPGGWAWTNLSGGVPDADDTSGALLALEKLRHITGDDPEMQTQSREAAENAVTWLLNLQNRDGGIPTFCRGWGKLPFDRSCPDITAHAIRAWTTWRPEMPAELQNRINRGLSRAFEYMRTSQRDDGSWTALWFGSQQTSDQENPVFGTAQALISLAHSGEPRLEETLHRGAQYLVQAQNRDGSWGAAEGVEPSLEETAQAVSALCTVPHQAVNAARNKGAAWLLERLEDLDPAHLPTAPIGLYFASLWYFEKLYPLIFVTDALRRLRSVSTEPAKKSVT